MKAIVDEKRAWLQLGAKIVAIALILWLLFGVFFGFRRVTGAAMDPYITDGDLIFYSRFNQEYKADDVILYNRDGRSYIARTVALPSEKIRADQEGYIFVNNEQAFDDPICNDEIEINQVNASSSKLYQGYFVINDNTDDANDSRTFGRIEEKDIYGKVMTVIRTRRP